MQLSKQKLDWKVDSDGCVIFPGPLGDSEIRSIEMSLSTCTISLSALDYSDDAEKELCYVVELKIPQYVSFVSDHLQNVVDAAYIFHRSERNKAEDFRDFAGTSQFPAGCTADAEYYFFISPITGGDLFVAAKSVDFYSYLNEDIAL